MGLGHGTGVEGRDLVVVAVGHDHGLGGVGVVQLTHIARLDAQSAHAAQVAGAILAHGGHGQGLAAKQLQAVGDVAGTATEIAAQRRHQERHVQDVQLLRQDLIGKLALKTHDGVKGEGTANQCSHGQTFVMGKRNQG